MMRWFLLAVSLLLSVGCRTGYQLKTHLTGKRWKLGDKELKLQQAEHPPLFFDQMSTTGPAVEARAGLPELVVGAIHSQGVRDVALSPDGRWLVTVGTYGNSFALWDTASGRKLRQVSGHGDDVRTVDVSPDGAHVASGGEDKTVRLWNAATGELVQRIDIEPYALLEMTARMKGEVLMVRFSPDGTKLAVAVDEQPRIFDVASGEELQALLTHRGDARTVAFSPDGLVLFSKADSVSDTDAEPHGEIIAWQVATGTKLWTRVLHEPSHGEMVVSPDGRRLALLEGRLGGDHKTEIAFLDAANGRDVARFAEVEGGFGGAMAWSPDGGALVVARGDSVEAFDPETKQRLRRWPALRRRHHGVKHGATSAAISRDGRTVYLAAGSEVSATDLGSGRLERVFGEPVLPLVGARVDRDYRKLLALQVVFTDDVWTGKLWDLELGGVRRATAPRGNTSSRSISPDLTSLATGKDKRLTVWDLATAKERYSEEVQGMTLHAIAYSSDGRYLATGGSDSDADASAKLWSADGKKQLAKLPHDKFVNHLAFSRDGRWLATAEYLGKKVRVFSVPDGELQAVLEHDDSVQQVVMSSDGRYVATAQSFLFAGRQIKIWDWSRQQLLYLIADEGLGSGGGIAFSPDGSTLAFSGVDHSIALWPIGSKELIVSPGHDSTVMQLRYTDDGRFLLSASSDGTARVWDGTSASLLLTMAAVGEGTDWVAVTPDGLFDGTPNGWRLLSWRFANDSFQWSPAEVFFGDFFRPGLVTEVFSGQRPVAPAKLAEVDRRQPLVSLGAPSGSAGNSREVTLEVEVREVRGGGATGSGARDLRLFRNDVLVQAWHGDVLAGKESVVLQATVPVAAGDNRFSAYAFNHDGIRSVDARLNVSGAAALQRKGVLYVVALSVDRYENPGFNLRYAGADAKELASDLSKRQRALGRFSATKIVRLADAEATKANILAAFGVLGGAAAPASAPAALKALAKAGPEDVIVLFYAGHGLNRDGTFYLIPHDLGFRGKRSELNDAAWETILTHSISDKELSIALEPVQAGHMLMVIDACHSGQALGGEGAGLGPTNARGLAQLAYDKGMNILTAAQGDQVAKEARSLGHGFLTYALVADGLRAGEADHEPRDGNITEREWLDYATYRVPLLHEKFVQTNGRALELVDDAGAVVRRAVKRGLQRPRVFYRREARAEGIIVAKTR